MKASLRSPYLLPRIALVDPALTHSVPPGVTASTGLDALTQLIEPYVSARAQPLTDALAEYDAWATGLRRAETHNRVIAPVIGDLQRRGHTSLRSLAQELNARGMKTRRGGSG